MLILNKLVVFDIKNNKLKIFDNEKLFGSLNSSFTFGFDHIQLGITPNL